MTASSTTAPIPLHGPADWRVVVREGRVELRRLNKPLSLRLGLYGLVFAGAVLARWDGMGVILGVLGAVCIPVLMFARMRALSVRDVLRDAYRVTLMVPPAPSGHYRESAKQDGYLEVDGERWDLADVELMQVHRIHRTGEHMHRTHHVWLRSSGRIAELGELAVPEDAQRLEALFRAHLPGVGGSSGTSKADSLPNDRRAVAVTVVAALVTWVTTFAAPFLVNGTLAHAHAWLLFVIGLGVLAIEATHAWLVRSIGRDSLVRNLRRRYRLDRE